MNGPRSKSRDIPPLLIYYRIFGSVRQFPDRSRLNPVTRQWRIVTSYCHGVSEFIERVSDNGTLEVRLFELRLLDNLINARLIELLPIETTWTEPAVLLCNEKN